MKIIKIVELFVRKCIYYKKEEDAIMPRGDYRVPKHLQTGRKPNFPGRQMKTVSIYIPDDLIPKLKQIGNHKLAEMIENENIGIDTDN